MVKLRALLMMVLVAGVLAGCGGPTLREKMDGTEANRQVILAAVKAYHEARGAYPPNLAGPPFIGENLPELPKELFKGKNRVVPEYDGKGGWMYNVATGEVYLNAQP